MARADLALGLGEHPGVAELPPDIARICGARAVYVRRTRLRVTLVHVSGGHRLITEVAQSAKGNGARAVFAPAGAL